MGSTTSACRRSSRPCPSRRSVPCHRCAGAGAPRPPHRDQGQPGAEHPPAGNGGRCAARGLPHQGADARLAPHRRAQRRRPQQHAAANCRALWRKPCAGNRAGGRGEVQGSGFRPHWTAIPLKRGRVGVPASAGILRPPEGGTPTRFPVDRELCSRFSSSGSPVTHAAMLALTPARRGARTRRADLAGEQGQGMPRVDSACSISACCRWRSRTATLEDAPRRPRATASCDVTGEVRAAAHGFLQRRDGPCIPRILPSRTAAHGRASVLAQRSRHAWVIAFHRLRDSAASYWRATRS